MNLPFLRYFMKDRTAEGGVAVVPRPVTPLDKPASERFGKTVMPNVSRVVGVDSVPDFSLEGPLEDPPLAVPSSAPRKISLGGSGSVAVGPKTADDPGPAAAERTIALQLVDLVPHLPAGLLETTPIDPEHRVLFKASELERGMASGRPTVLLRSIFQQAPDFFLRDVEATDKREVVLPFNKVLEQFTAFQVRSDQMASDSVPQLETPFLKMTIEDGQRLGTPATPVPSPAPATSSSSEPAPATVLAAPAPLKPTFAKPPEAAAGSPQPIGPIRLPLPNEVETSGVDGPAPKAVGLEQSSARPPRAARISPNGMGVPAAERVPASSGPPVPTSLPSPLPPPPTRIPFKVSPPSNDLHKKAMPAPPVKAAAIAFSADGPRVRLRLRNVLRAFLPFQLTGSIDEVPETAAIEIPFSIIQPQLSLGRIVVSPAQLQAALPEEYRVLLKIEEIELPVALPLEEVLQNLPNESLRLRGDQEEMEITEGFETPFSTKAAEDAARLKVSTGPIAKPAVGVAAGVDPDDKNLDFAATPEGIIRPGSPIPSTAPARTALQVAFETDETLDAKSIVAHASRLPGVSACAIVFSDGLSLAGNIPAKYEAEALCALAPSIVKRIDDQMIGASLGPLNGITLYCAKTPVSFFAHGNICLAALHSADALAAEIRARLSCVVRELAQMYAQPA
jgi:predicted regulator of Ras-like GTPase activity (Roadblock/LC7/MglB family)